MSGLTKLGGGEIGRKSKDNDTSTLENRKHTHTQSSRRIASSSLLETKWSAIFWTSWMASSGLHLGVTCYFDRKEGYVYI